MKRHNWINYPTASNKKCTRCGIVLKTNKGGIYGQRFVKPDGIELKENPGCIDN